ncbi:MAG: exo-alpha-sialidase [Acidobacteria bacterium]|nr:exo-alpha-sialidase [Acidobacteriota bacterium]
MSIAGLLLTAFAASGHAQTAALTQKQLDTALERPRILFHPGPEYQDENRTEGMVIGWDRTPKGRIWAAWIGNGDSDNGWMSIATSDDDGKTWSKPRFVIDPVDQPGLPQRRTLVGNLWTDPKGRLWLFFDQSLGYFDGRGGDWYMRCDHPDAKKPKWTKPVRFADGATLNKPTVLSNGDWLLPVSLWPRDVVRTRLHKKIANDPLADAHHELDSMRMASVYASTDQGKTWTRRGGVSFPHQNFDEHMIVELKDGRLWMLARTYETTYESFSSDKGRTWSEPKPSPIRNVNVRFFLRRLQSGNLLLVKNGRVDERLKKREKMMAFLSGDDGKTWKGGLMLDERMGVTYPDGFQSPDGTINILYDRNRATDGEILRARFRESDILAGDFLSPGSGTKILVNKPLGPRPEKSAK